MVDEQAIGAKEVDTIHATERVRELLRARPGFSHVELSGAQSGRGPHRVRASLLLVHQGAIAGDPGADVVVEPTAEPGDEWYEVWKAFAVGPWDSFMLDQDGHRQEVPPRSCQ